MKTGHQEFGIYLGVACAITLSHTPLNSLPFEVGAIGEALGLSASKTGFLATIELSAYALANLIMSPLIHRMSIRRFALVAGLVAMGATLLTAFSKDLLIFGIARALAGAGFGCILGCASAAGAAAHVPERAYSVGMGVSIIFGILIPQVLSHSAHLHSIGPVPLLGHSGVFIGIAFLTALMIPTMVFLPDKADDGQVDRRPARALSSATWLLTLAIMTFFSVGVFSVYTFIERKAHSLGMSPVEIGNMISLASGLGMVGSIASTWLGRRIGLTMPLILGLVLESISSFLTSRSGTPHLLLPSTVFFLIGWYFVFPYIMGLGASLDRTGRLATAVGAAYLVGSSIAAPLGGYFVDSGGFAAIGVIGSSLCALACLAVIALGRLTPARSVLTTSG